MTPYHFLRLLLFFEFRYGLQREIEEHRSNYRIDWWMVHGGGLDVINQEEAAQGTNFIH